MKGEEYPLRGKSEDLSTEKEVNKGRQRITLAYLLITLSRQLYSNYESMKLNLLVGLSCSLTISFLTTSGKGDRRNSFESSVYYIHE